jgi:hypothetical protein
MTKKNVKEDLDILDIKFEMLNISYKALRFYPSKMTLDVKIIQGSEEGNIINIPFAHLPKKIKKVIKPN